MYSPAGQPTRSSSLVNEFPSIVNKSPEELEKLLTDEEEFENYFTQLEQVLNVETVHRELKEGNESLARSSLSKQPELERLRESISNLEPEWREKKMVFDEQTKLRSEAIKRFSKDNILNQLRNKVATIDHEADDLANQYLTGQLELDVFLKSFRETKKTYHIHAARLERLLTDPSILDLE
ncbi:hypothetical protein K7432_005904 [Basidiobolus ranarum]|uniref:VPS37 C-terminal domain-containing protein n=1 Tax=Basidiobolus ranarum TaxID=34480 RepID=A0ABR2W2F2_9FUNG